MKPGSKPKPTALKELAGNPGGRPLNAKEPRPGVPDPKVPRGMLGKHGQKLFKDLSPKLVDLGVLTEVDMAAFELMCSHYDLARDALEIVNKMGLFIQDRDHQPRKNPAIQVYRDNSAAFKAYLVEFGMTPSSRTRIEANPIDQEPSLADLLFDGIDDD